MNRAALPEELNPDLTPDATAFAAPLPALRDLALGLLGALLDGAKDEAPAPEARFLRDAHQYCMQHGAPWTTLVHAVLETPGRADTMLAVARKRFALEPLDMLALALASAVEDDSLVGRVLAWMQAPTAGTRPTLALLARAFAPVLEQQRDSHETQLLALDETRCLYALAQCAAVQAGLLTIDDDGRPLCERVLRMTPHLAATLAGEDRRHTHHAQSTTGLLQLPVHSGELAQALDLWADRLCMTPRATLVIRSAAPAEARALAAALVQRLNARAHWLDDVMPAGADAWLALTGNVPVFTITPAPGEVLPLPGLRHYTGPVLVVSGLDGGVQRDDGPVADWRVPVPDEAQRSRCWQDAGHAADFATRAARRYRAGYAQVIEQARLAALVGNAEQAAAMTSAGRALDALAQHMADEVPDDALVVSETVRADLGRVLLRCEAREHLHDQLGPAARTRANQGVRVLFTGASGTGKSLAAQWIASQLGLAIYRVDLSAMLSKWIGDTEKNLAELLARAEHADAVLLFDEADTLFGKRTEVSNANDRFANAQTNYLLQRIETHAGIVVLTSNSRARFDSAFTRRLDFIVDFTAPDAAARRALWFAHAGEHTQCTHVDFNRLAALSDLAGGHIRNAVLSAAASAHAAQARIAYADLADGVRTEYRKLGRTPPQEL
jgi:hypothetical protein